MFVKLPTYEKTLWNESGRNHATLNAQMPPDDPPAIARPSGSSVIFSSYRFFTSGSTSSIRNFEYLSLTVSYSTLRFEYFCRGFAPGAGLVVAGGFLTGSLPGLMNTPT